MSSLNGYQKDAVNYPGSALISASPGSGKTKTIVERTKKNLKKSEKPLAIITYTNAAADEVRRRIEINKEIEVFIGTIHSFCLEYILRPFKWIYNWRRIKIISYNQQKEFIDYMNVHFPERSSFNIDDLSKIRPKYNGELDLQVEWWHRLELHSFASYYYQFLKKEGLIDFNLILFRSYKILSENKFVSKSLGSKFQEILVDEFQDTNELQYEIIKEIYKASKVRLFFVGDPKQSIMRFAGATKDAFNRAKKDFDLQQFPLNETYRSTNNIVNYYSKIFEKHPQIINSSKYSEVDIPVEIVNCKAYNDCTKFRCNFNCEEKSDLYLLKNYVEKLIKLDYKEKDISILAHSNYDCYTISSFLRSEYNVVGIGALPHKMKNLKNSSFDLLRAIARLKLRFNTTNYRRLLRYIENHTFENSLANRDSTGINQFIKKIEEDIDLNIDLNKGLSDIKTIMDDYFGIKHNTIDEIINRLEKNKEWNLRKYFMALEGKNGINVDTLHSSKGLEYEAVILFRADDGKIPFYFSNSTPSEESIEDGRKLFYVGVSRAKKKLIIIHRLNKSRFIHNGI